MVNTDEENGKPEKEDRYTRLKRLQREYEKAKQVAMKEAEARLQKAARQRRQYRIFANHLIVFVALMALLIPVNISFMPDKPYWIFVTMGWGVVLFIHGIVAAMTK